MHGRPYSPTRAQEGYVMYASCQPTCYHRNKSVVETIYVCMPIVTELQNGTMSCWYTCIEVLDDVLPGVQALSMEGEDAEMAKALAKSKDEYDEKNQLREESFGGNQLMCIF